MSRERAVGGRFGAAAYDSRDESSATPSVNVMLREPNFECRRLKPKPWEGDIDSSL